MNHPALIRFVLIILAIRLLPGQYEVLAQNDRHLAKVWADSVMSTLTPEERAGQLILVRANDPGKPYDKRIAKYISDYNIGGVVFFRGQPSAQLKQTNEWQAMAKTPLLVAIDAEWGVGMRIDSIITFPYQMTLGAIQDDSLIYRMGVEVGKQCHRMGIHMNFAPVVDINSNPANPVIGMRSFGQSRKNVSRKGIMYMKGMQSQGILTVAKHFPGHGDTGTDSHYTLPVLTHDQARLDSLELYPFRELIRNGVDAVMTAHLYIPSLEKTGQRPSTLSGSVIDTLLKKQMGFEGLVITDALDMKGVTAYFSPGEIEVMALLAGNDILLMPQDVPRAMKAIREAVSSGCLSQETIDQRCRKVLISKYLSGLSESDSVGPGDPKTYLNRDDARVLRRQLFADAITLLRNKHDLLPLKRLDTLSIACLSIGPGKYFQDMLAKYAPVAFLESFTAPGEKEISMILDKLEGYNLVIIDIHGNRAFSPPYHGIDPSAMDLVREVSAHHKTILNIFACPYSLVHFGDTLTDAIIMSYQSDPDAQELSAQMIFGGIGASGRIPVSAGVFPQETGISTRSVRLSRSLPAELGIEDFSLKAIDSIVLEGIKQKAYPGCQVLAAKDGKIFYNKSFGYHTYDSKLPVKDNDIYDLASITKIAAMTPVIMKLTDDSLMDPDFRLSSYLPFLKRTGKENIIISEVLAHQSGFRSWIPYYLHVLDSNQVPDTSIFRKSIDEEHTVRVAENLYTSSWFRNVIIDSIRFSGLKDNKEYKYSDLGFYLLAIAVENITNKPLQDYVQEHFYQRLGLQNTGYLPRRHYSLNRIIPTENDKAFRHQLIHGDVHDQGAALLGGVSGHAGLFSNAEDIAVIMQLYMNYGSYGGERYIDSLTIRQFTRVQFPLLENRRGLGFDKPMLDYQEGGPNCRSASPSSFGHSGFTGTYAWADPENGLIFVFLSNRIHPDATNNKISELNIRTTIHQAFYDLFNTSNTKPAHE